MTPSIPSRWIEVFAAIATSALLSCGEPTLSDVCEDICTDWNDCGIEVGCDNPDWLKACVDQTNKTGCRPQIEEYLTCIDDADQCSACDKQDYAVLYCWIGQPP
jgi:hypothetical protein